MNTLRKFVALLLLVPCALGERQQVVTGHNRQVGAPPCVVPTLVSKWSTFDPANTCGGGCVNGAPIITQNDSIGGNTGTAITGSGTTPLFTSAQINGQPAWTFVQVNGPRISLSGNLANTGSITAYAVVKPNCSANECALFAPTGGNGLEFGIDSSNRPFAAWINFATFATGSALSSSTWYTLVIEMNFGTSSATIFSCVAGTCSTVASGTNVQATQTPIAILGGFGGIGSHAFNGEIAEWGYRANIASLTDIATWSQCKYGI